MTQPLYKQPHSDTIDLSLTAESNSNHNTAGDFDQIVTRRLKTTKQSALRKIQTHFVGWRSGAINFSLIALVIFLVNLLVTIYGIRSHPSNHGVLFEGDCNLIKHYNTGLHVLINVVSTVLVSGSNYCMQCLCAPNRREVDNAHAQGIWMDIGIPSLRNLRMISRPRKVLWFLLGASSIPLHLLYNSAVFGSVASYSYFAFSVSESFIQSPECRGCTSKIVMNSPYEDGMYPDVLASLWQDARDGKLDRLEPAACIEQYAKTIQSDRQNLLLVARDSSLPVPENNTYSHGSMVYWAETFTAPDAGYSHSAAEHSYDWICSGLTAYGSCPETVPQIMSTPEKWHVGSYRGNYPVEYCLSQEAKPRCKLQFIPIVLIIVTALNLIKAAFMVCAVLLTRESPLITMGDAVASFLEREDPTTKNMCLLSLADIRKKGYQAGSRVWNNDRFRWKDAANRRSRVSTITLFLTIIATVAILLYVSITSVPIKFPLLVRMGYGAVDGRLIINGRLDSSVASSAMLANTPQVVLSFLYFSYNALFTAMLGGFEWASYTRKRKGLRVSSRPVGAQRSTYFLQLPYRFGLPLVVLSGGLHWLVSQSIFLVAVDFYDVGDKPWAGNWLENPSVKTCGFSPIAILSSLIAGIVMLAGIVAFGFVPYRRGMTLVGSCSMAISAACHPGEHVDGNRVATQKLKWGAVANRDDGLGHCTFSAEEVGSPVVGEMYAGKLRSS